MRKKDCCGSNALKSSELNRRITLQQVATIIDPEGIPVETWTNVVTIWANRKPLSGKEYFEAAAINAEKTVKYRVRYRKGIRPNMRLLDAFDGQTYNIVAVLDDYYGDRTQTHIMAELIKDG